MPFVEDEEKMWSNMPAAYPMTQNNEELDNLYQQQALRVLLETNREKLKNFYEALRRPGYIDDSPKGQRRHRWDDKKKSRFIESFLLNIPVPPLFFFEVRPNKYEVIDGKQRIRAINDFFSDTLVLRGLEYWPQLDGRKYSTLPGGVLAGIERRSISYTVVQNESVENDDEAAFIKQAVFQRLNTGGAKMMPQEIRNSFYGGYFSELLTKLAEENEFRAVWAPSYSRGIPKKIESRFIDEMSDVELILRFFAYRHASKIVGPPGRFLDRYMLLSRKFGKRSTAALKELFNETFCLAREIYRDKIFREYIKTKEAWGKAPKKAIWDAQLIALSECLEHADKLKAARTEIVIATEKLFKKKPLKELLGHGSADSIRHRIKLFRKLYKPFYEA